MTAMRAPAGGAIVNNQYYKGGRMIPGILQKIRSVRNKIAKLARVTPDMKSFNIVPPKPVEVLTDRQVQNIEKAHGLHETEKLRRTVNPDGTISANTDDIAQFFDNLHRKRLGHTDVVKKLQDPTVEDNEKFAHLINHMTDEAGHAKRRAGNALGWYSKDLDELDSALTEHYKFTPARLTLAKAILAFTSKDQKPVPNLMTAARILDDAFKQHPEKPFHHLRGFNYAATDEWLAKQPPGTMHVGSPENAYNWLKQRGYKPGEIGYMSAPTVVDKVTDQPMGRLSGTSLIPFAGYSREQMAEALKNKSAKVIPHTPKVSETGDLLPKAWGPAQSISQHIEILRNLVHDLGEEGAAKFLTELHPEKDLKKYKKTVDRGDNDRGEHLSGAYLFGPKFAPFFENIQKNHNRLTADKWWSRTWNRYLGTMYDAVHGPATTPRTGAERKQMKIAAEKAAAKLGLTVAELQATLWYHEQKLHRMFGATNESQSFADAAKVFREIKGAK